MQREIEVKVLNIDVDEMEEKLLALGGKEVSYEYQTNYTFAPEEGAFSNGYLRIRESKFTDHSKKIELTFKEVENVDDFRVNREYTVNIDSISMMTKILNQLGVSLQFKGEKERRSYTYKGQRFDIDIWDKNTYPEPYMEIEFTNKDKVDEVLDDLAIDRANVTTQSISELRENLKNL